jgi:tetratricopeptide (TPR) repeat protein
MPTNANVRRSLLRAAVELLLNPFGAIGHLFDALFASRDRRAAVRALFDEAEPWTLETSPAAVLDADRGLVPFHAGRERELADLDAWLDAPEGLPLMLRLYVAPGGFGKTRLLRELVKRRRGDERTRAQRLGDLLRGERWDAGFLRETVPDADLPPLLAGRRPLLLVLDYAESRGPQIRALVAAARAAKRPRIRLVLLARSEEGWWHELKTAGDGVGDVFLGPAVRDPLPLGPLADTPELRATAFAAALSAFTDYLPGHQPPATTPPLDDPAFERILLVHALALAAVEGETVPPHDLLEWLVARERRGIDRAARRAGLTDETWPPGHRAAALLTLALGADSRPAVEEIVARTPGLPTPAVGPCTDILHRLYRGKRWCESVQPDLVGEHLVEKELEQADEDRDPRLLEASLGEGVSPERLQAALTVLTRLAKRDPTATRHLDAAFRLRPLAPLAEAALAVAQAEGDPIGRHLATALAEADDAELAARLYPRLPETTTALREVALEVTRQRQQAVLAALDDQASDEEWSELAGFWNDLSVRLGEVGRREEGLAAIEEAVKVYRRLEESRPEAFEPNLATSLNNLSIDLAVSGRLEEGLAAIEEAVAILRRLAESRPEAFEPDLAMSLNNLSVRLAVSGRLEEGLAAIEEAVAIRRRLAKLHPEVFDPDLAQSLNNLSIRLQGFGRREEGVAAIAESVKVYRRLAESRPEAFEPALATSLNNHAVHLAEVGRREDGLAAIEEAVTIRRRLTESRPEVFESDLATSLSNLSLRLAQVGRLQEGLAAIEEVVAIRNRLAESRPEVFEPDLAASMTNLSIRLGDLGHKEEGLAANEEAVTIWRRLSESRPGAFEPDLAGSLNNLSIRLAEMGRQEEGLAAIEEAVTIRRRLSESRPEAFQPDLARSLNNLSLRLPEMGRREEGLAAIEEAVAIRRRLAKSRPEAFEPDLARSLGNLAERLLDLGLADPATNAAEEALRRLLPHVAGNPEGLGGLGRACLATYRRCAAASGRPPDDELVVRAESLL